MQKMTIAQRRPQYKMARNQKIAELYLNSENRMSTSALARMFQLSQTRVWQIVKDWVRKENQETSLNKAGIDYNNDMEVKQHGEK